MAAPVAPATGGKESEAKPSKHQVQKAREKAKKDAKVTCSHGDRRVAMVTVA